MNIKKIKKLSSGKYQVVFDNGEKILTYDEVIIKKNILYKKTLTNKEIEEINKSNSYYDVYNASIKYLSKRMHSCKEFENFVLKYRLSEFDKEKIIQDMKNIKLLDDLSFMKCFISDKFRFSNDGLLKIKRDLLKHDILESDIDVELSKIDREDVIDKARKIIDKKIRTIKGSNYYIKQKLYLYMNDLGYDKDIVDICMADEVDDSKSIELDFNKIYQKSPEILCFRGFFVFWFTNNHTVQVQHPCFLLLLVFL